MADEAVVRILVDDYNSRSPKGTPDVPAKERMRVGQEALAALEGLKSTKIYEERQKEILEAEARVTLRAMEEQLAAKYKIWDAETDLILEQQAAARESHIEELNSIVDLKAQKEAALAEQQAAVKESHIEELNSVVDLAEQKRLAIEEEADLYWEQLFAARRAIENNDKLLAEQLNATRRAIANNDKLFNEQLAAARRAIDDHDKLFAEQLAAARRAIRNEYEKIPEAEAAFDPTYEATKRHGRKLESQSVDEEYERLYGGPAQKGGTNKGSTPDVLGAIGRGMGGTGGKLVNAGAQVTSAMSGALGTAGTAGVVAMIAKMAIDATIGAVKTGIRGIGSVAATIASSDADPSKSIGEMGDTLSKTSESALSLGFTLAIAGVAVGETTKAFADLMQAIDKTAQRYGEYSPAIAQAQAIAEIRQTMGDFRRAQEVGSEMAKYLMAQSDLQQKFEDIKIKLLMKILPLVTGALQILEAIMPSGQGIENAIGTVATPLGVIGAAITQIMNLLHEERTPEGKDPTDMLNDPMFNTVGTGGRVPGSPGLVPRDM